MACFTVLAGIKGPSLVYNTGKPSGTLSATQLAGVNGIITWSVEFDMPIQRPTKPTNIQCYYANGTLLFEMDASIFPTVYYNNYTLSFESGNSFEVGVYWHSY